MAILLRPERTRRPALRQRSVCIVTGRSALSLVGLHCQVDLENVPAGPHCAQNELAGPHGHQPARTATSRPALPAVGPHGQQAVCFMWLWEA